MSLTRQNGTPSTYSVGVRSRRRVAAAKAAAKAAAAAAAAGAKHSASTDMQNLRVTATYYYSLLDIIKIAYHAQCAECVEDGGIFISDVCLFDRARAFFSSLQLFSSKNAGQSSNTGREGPGGRGQG